MLRLAVALLAASPAPPPAGPPAPAAPAADQTASVTANQALRRYRELTSALPVCTRDNAASDEIVVCAPGPKDRYRAWNGDPVAEPRSPRLARNRDDAGGRNRAALGDTGCAGGQNFGRCGLATEQGR